MTKQTCESCVGHSARLSLEQDKGNLRELTAGDRFMIVRVNSWKTLAALMLAMSVASIGAPSAAQIQTQQDKLPRSAFCPSSAEPDNPVGTCG